MHFNPRYFPTLSLHPHGRVNDFKLCQKSHSSRIIYIVEGARSKEGSEYAAETRLSTRSEEESNFQFIVSVFVGR